MQDPHAQAGVASKHAGRVRNRIYIYTVVAAAASLSLPPSTTVAAIYSSEHGVDRMQCNHGRHSSVLCSALARHRGRAMPDLNLLLLPRCLILLLLLLLLVVVHPAASRIKALLARAVDSILFLPPDQLSRVFVTDRVTAHRLLLRGSLSNRPPSFSPSAILSRRRHQNITSAPYGQHWRAIRHNLTSGFLHPARLRLYAPVRRRALRGLIADLADQRVRQNGAVVHAAESIRYAMFGLVAAMCFGDGVGANRVRAMANAQRELVESLDAVRVFAEAKVPAVARLVYRGRWKKLAALRQKQEEMYLPLVDTRRGRHRPSGEPPAYVDTLIDLRVPDDDGPTMHKPTRRRRRLSDGELVGMCSEFLGAATETTAAALQWVMANLVKRPDMQEAVRREIDAVVGADAEEVSEDALVKLEYLNAVIMEALRLHPPTSFVFRQVTEDEHVVHDGRRLPAGTKLCFPLASLAKDGTAWADPDEFKPQRFLAPFGDTGLVAAAGSDGGAIKMMPFGAGQRTCPGRGIAVLHIGYFAANLVREFEWREGEGELAVDLRPRVEFFTDMKRPFRAYLELRRPEALTGVN